MSEESSSDTERFPIQTPGNFENATEREEPTEVFEGPDPVEPIPVIRHHLHELLLVIADASVVVGSLDLMDSVRAGLGQTKASPLARRLERQETTLAAYLGLLDDEVEDGE